MAEQKIFARKFKIKNFYTQKLNKHHRRNQIIEFSNFFKYQLPHQEQAAIPKYQFEVFILKDGEEHSKKHLFVSFYLTCPPAIMRNYRKFLLKLSILNANYLKCCTREWEIHFENNETKDWFKYITCETILNKSNGLLDNDKLTLHCEVIAIDIDEMEESTSANEVTGNTRNITFY